LKQKQKERGREGEGEKRDAPLIKTGYSYNNALQESVFIQKEGSHGAEKVNNVSRKRKMKGSA